MKPILEIFTDGSCHTQQRVGAWASIILVNEQKIVLSGSEIETTHNRMEILAVLKAIHYVRENYVDIGVIKLVLDSQYVIGLVKREGKFLRSNFKTSSGNEIRNKDLVVELLNLVKEVEIRFEKIKAHQKKSDITKYNIEADKLSRSIVRSIVKGVVTLPNLVSFDENVRP